MGRPAVKKTRKLAEAEEAGKLKAQAKARKKEKLRDKIERLAFKMADQPATLPDLALYGALAYLSFDKMGKTWESALYGPIALKLALAQNLPASIVGVAGLAALGVISAGERDVYGNDVYRSPEEYLDAVKDDPKRTPQGGMPQVQPSDMESSKDWIKPSTTIYGGVFCPSGYTLKRVWTASVCVPLEGSKK